MRAGELLRSGEFVTERDMQDSDFFPSDPAKTCVRKQRVGINTLKNMLPELSRKCGIDVRYIYQSFPSCNCYYLYVPQWNS